MEYKGKGNLESHAFSRELFVAKDLDAVAWVSTWVCLPSRPFFNRVFNCLGQ